MHDTLAIETKDLAKRFGKTDALAGLDLSVPRGCVFGLLGPTARGRRPRCACWPRCCAPMPARPGCSALM